jgi:hypothetical protein
MSLVFAAAKIFDQTVNALATHQDGPMAPINPFRIAVPDADLADLKDKLARMRWPRGRVRG